MGRKYNITATSTSITSVTAQDLLTIVPGAGFVGKISSIKITQENRYGDAAADGQLISINRATAGSGGTAVTPSKVSPGDAASGATVRRGDTTIATSLTELVQEAMNDQAGFFWTPTEKFEIELSPSTTIGLVIKLLAPAPAAATTFTVQVEYEELG
jgi:hypothetical protein